MLVYNMTKKFLKFANVVSHDSILHYFGDKNFQRANFNNTIFSKNHNNHGSRQKAIYCSELYLQLL